MLRLRTWLAIFACFVSLSARADGVRWVDGSREVVEFGTLESLLDSARPWLSERELAGVRSSIELNGVTLPGPGGAGLIHRSWVLGVRPVEAAAFLQGPATGEGGYAPDFQSSTPQAEQVGQAGTLARNARLPGIPEYFASDARGVKLSDRIVMTWIAGRAANGFSIHILAPANGGKDSEFIEIGYYIAEARPRTLFDLPGALAVRLAEHTVGRPLQRFASRQIAEIHMGKMNVSHSVAVRVERSRCQTALEPRA